MWKEHHPLLDRRIICKLYAISVSKMANANEFKWETIKVMPTKRVFSSPVEVKGMLYVIGGCDKMGVPIDAFEVTLILSWIARDPFTTSVSAITLTLRWVPLLSMILFTPGVVGTIDVRASLEWVLYLFGRQ